ncbi:hypothetical protein NXS98_09065 [Fontisphaera persica]|uniref:hypothetical protein n=1 Tax=Fontisphaera persica TaxID=2974023 RepID=UPI0024BF33A3|nr:hypothetical protein [Fontisphaera persica]WCJ57880.1 hypothetical protein NXS98_09065 [Fontisphaera persica]
MKSPHAWAVRLAWMAGLLGVVFSAAAQSNDLWGLAQKYAGVHRFSTLFTAQDVRRYLSTEEGLQQAIEWCKQTAVTKVYIESYRDGYTAEKEALIKARDTFRQAGFLVSGCVTPTKIGKLIPGWGNNISCYTDAATQQRAREIYAYAAALFDETMIDDFWFTECTCAECDAARRARVVTIGDQKFPVAGESWADYRSELMLQLSRLYVLEAGRQVNPRATFILKYPQWYDFFHVRGYDVVRQTAAFDRIWVGTETRDYQDKRWGGTVQYEAYFIMRWLGGLGGAKCGGGWYDWLGTTEKTYLEQARLTVLGGARESLLFCYGGLQGSTGPKNIEALRAQIPRLLATAAEVAKRQPIGIAAYKPPGSDPGKERYVYDFVGMLGLPLLPCHEFPTNAAAAFFPVHCLKDEQLVPKLRAFLAAGKPVLITDGLKARLEGQVDWSRGEVQVLEVKGDPKRLLELSREELDKLRVPLLRPFKTRFSAPNKISLHLYRDGSWVICNFNEDFAGVELNGVRHPVGERGWLQLWK